MTKQRRTAIQAGAEGEVLPPDVKMKAKPAKLDEEAAARSSIVIRTFSEAKPRAWESFFRCQPNPVLRSQLITYLMAGKPLISERVPISALLDVVLISTAARIAHDAEILDDYAAICDRATELLNAPQGSTPWSTRSEFFNSSNYVRWAIVILRERPAAERTDLFEGYGNEEVHYLPDLVGWYLHHEVPSYFASEVEETEKVGPETTKAHRSIARVARGRRAA